MPYTAIEVNPWTKKETKFSGYNKVPLALIDGQLVTDSADIVNTIQNMFDDKPRSAHDEKWLTWVDEKFVRISFTPSLMLCPLDSNAPTQHLSYATRILTILRLRTHRRKIHHHGKESSQVCINIFTYLDIYYSIGTEAPSRCILSPND